MEIGWAWLYLAGGGVNSDLDHWSVRTPTTGQFGPFLARLYESTGRAIAVTPASALASASALLKMLKFLVKVFMSLYLLKLLMDQVDT